MTQLEIPEVLALDVAALRAENEQLRALVVELGFEAKLAQQRSYDLGFNHGQLTLGMKLATARRMGDDLNTFRF